MEWEKKNKENGGQKQTGKQTAAVAEPKTDRDTQGNREFRRNRGGGVRQKFTAKIYIYIEDRRRRKTEENKSENI